MYNVDHSVDKCLLLNMPSPLIVIANVTVVPYHQTITSTYVILLIIAITVANHTVANHTVANHLQHNPPDVGDLMYTSGVLLQNGGMSSWMSVLMFGMVRLFSRSMSSLTLSPCVQLAAAEQTC